MPAEDSRERVNVRGTVSLAGSALVSSRRMRSSEPETQNSSSPGLERTMTERLRLMDSEVAKVLREGSPGELLKVMKCWSGPLLDPTLVHVVALVWRWTVAAMR